MDKAAIIWKILRRREVVRRRREEKDFDSSSIGDMAFLLLIFFIVTGSFMLRQGIFFSLPSKTAGAIKLDRKEIFEVFPQDEGFLYNGVVINRDEFKEKLALHKINSPEGVLVIRMRKEVNYNRLVDTLSVAKETGLTRVSLKNAEQGT